MGNMTAAETARFASKTVRDGDCLLWTGPLDRDGYGGFFLRGVTRRAHRVAWFDAFGELPPEMVVNHTCRNRACVNAQFHLQAVTRRENSLKDSTSRGYINSQKQMCPEGHPYDGVETHKGRASRVCTRCRREKRAAAARRRYAAGRASLSV